MTLQALSWGADDETAPSAEELARCRSVLSKTAYALLPGLTEMGCAKEEKWFLCRSFEMKRSD